MGYLGQHEQVGPQCPFQCCMTLSWRNTTPCTHFSQTCLGLAWALWAQNVNYPKVILAEPLLLDPTQLSITAFYWKSIASEWEKNTIGVFWKDMIQHVICGCVICYILNQTNKKSWQNCSKQDKNWVRSLS